MQGIWLSIIAADKLHARMTPSLTHLELAIRSREVTEFLDRVRRFPLRSAPDFGSDLLRRLAADQRQLLGNLWRCEGDTIINSARFLRV